MTKSGILSKLCEWLDNPHVEIRVSETDREKRLLDEVEKLKAENDRVMSLYKNELYYNMRLQDLLKEHGISYR